MAKIIRGTVSAISAAETKSGLKCACLKLQARGNWDEKKYEREESECFVYYYDQKSNDATNMLSKDYLVGAEVALVAEPTKREGLYFGKGLPITQGFLKVPAELKPRTEEDAKAFFSAFSAAKRYRRIAENYDIDINDVNDIVALYAAIGASDDPILCKLRTAATALYWGEKFSYIGPVGGVYDVSGGKVRISVCPYHRKDEPAEWADVTFWDSEQADKIKKSGIKSGDLIYLANLFKRPDYKGKPQYSGKAFERFCRKEDR